MGKIFFPISPFLIPFSLFIPLHPYLSIFIPIYPDHPDHPALLSPDGDSDCFLREDIIGMATV